MIEYEGYTGLIEVNVEDGVISGRVLGIRDVVAFEGDTVAEAVQAFRDSVDDYLDFCVERGVAPDKPFSGKFIVRISPELHRKLAVGAEGRGMSLKSYVEKSLEASVSGLVLMGASAERAEPVKKTKAAKRSLAWPFPVVMPATLRA